MHELKKLMQDKRMKPTKDTKKILEFFGEGTTVSLNENDLYSINITINEIQKIAREKAKKLKLDGRINFIISNLKLAMKKVSDEIISDINYDKTNRLSGKNQLFQGYSCNIDNNFQYTKELYKAVFEAKNLLELVYKKANLGELTFNFDFDRINFEHDDEGIRINLERLLEYLKSNIFLIERNHSIAKRISRQRNRIINAIKKTESLLNQGRQKKVNNGKRQTHNRTAIISM